MAQVHVITGIDRRRRWSEEQKRAIVAASFAPGASVQEIARHADIRSNQIYRWRHKFSTSSSGFAQVLVAPPAPIKSETASQPAETIEVAVTDGSRVRIPVSVSPELATAIIKAMVGR